MASIKTLIYKIKLLDTLSCARERTFSAEFFEETFVNSKDWYYLFVF